VRKFARLTATAVALLALAACGSTSRTISTFDGPAYGGPGFTNVLVLAVADSYNNRATFERTLAKEISSGSASATAYYSLTKMDDQIDRPAIEKLVEKGGFDAVLITRVLSSDIVSNEKTGSSATKVTRKDSALFRYDYEELNEPATLTMDVNAIISSELFSVASGDKVWAIETDISENSSVGVIVVDAADIVARELRRGGLIAK
jgi:hypothetical protein